MKNAKLVHVGHPALRKKNVPINFPDPQLADILKNMIAGMHAAELAGIAAPQIGINKQIFITEPRKTPGRNTDTDELRVYINPKLLKKSDENIVIYEGCGSVPDVFGPVNRCKSVTVEAYNEQGKKFRLETDGLLARIIFHELDHLQGVEFTKYVDKDKLISKERYYQEIKNQDWHVNNSKTTYIKLD